MLSINQTCFKHLFLNKFTSNITSPPEFLKSTMASYSLKKNPEQYIEHLQILNRNRRQRDISANSQRELLAKREQNFNLFMSGANEIRIREQRKRDIKETSKSPGGKKQINKQTDANNRRK